MAVYLKKKIQTAWLSSSYLCNACIELLRLFLFIAVTQSIKKTLYTKNWIQKRLLHIKVKFLTKNRFFIKQKLQQCSRNFIHKSCSNFLIANCEYIQLVLTNISGNIITSNMRGMANYIFTPSFYWYWWMHSSKVTK